MTRWGGRRWLVVVGFPVALVLTLIYAPIERYRPSCGGWKVRHYFDGPMRQVFVDKMTEAMAEDGFPHIRVGNSVFIRFHDVDDFIINNDWKIAEAIGLGYGPGDSRFTPPPILTDIMDKARQAVEGDPSLSETKRKRETNFLFRDDCELIRAAAIRIEDMAPDDLLRYVPKSPLPPQCTPYNMRGWRRECGAVVRGDTVITPASRWPN
ncbi:hypothetical protein [Azospirillum sp.]|uniref:hypothetical protein n=1 Tax=Azospirillum sp. TaxID=34012 RepID=UPI002D6ACDA6|nr:hypothetical protein [Azospirillum sp.]HYF86120.1 hypothetical protein [Azospirillum sp.]